MSRYAENTTVSVERTQAEIKQLTQRYGAKRYATGYDEDSRLAVIQFEMRDRRVHFRLQLPDPMDREFRYANNRVRADQARRTAYDKECRRLWRSLLLVIKAKLESVESGVETFEEAFLSQIWIPGAGQTYGEFAVPQLAAVYERGELPPMLPGLSDVRQLGPGR